MDKQLLADARRVAFDYSLKAQGNPAVADRYADFYVSNYTSIAMTKNAPHDSVHPMYLECHENRPVSRGAW